MHSVGRTLRSSRRRREFLASRRRRAIPFGVAERGDMPTRSTFLFASLDAVLEWLAAVVGFCLFLSINYNITSSSACGRNAVLPVDHRQRGGGAVRHSPSFL